MLKLAPFAAAAVLAAVGAFALAWPRIEQAIALRGSGVTRRDVERGYVRLVRDTTGKLVIRAGRNGDAWLDR